MLVRAYLYIIGCTTSIPDNRSTIAGDLSETDKKTKEDSASLSGSDKSSSQLVQQLHHIHPGQPEIWKNEVDRQKT